MKKYNPKFHISMSVEKKLNQSIYNFDTIMEKAMDELIDSLYIDCKEDEPKLKAYLEQIKAKKDRKKLDSIIVQKPINMTQKRKL
jgi:stress response protein YsnF